MRKLSQEWPLKTVLFSLSGESHEYTIVMQNSNRPCSFIEICNILILREQIVISPEGRKIISFESLVFLVHDYIAKTKTDVDVTELLHIMSPFTRPMTFNPAFTSVAIRPTGDELRLFEATGISLVHGWLVDPASPEYSAVRRVENYESAQNLIVEAACLINPAGGASAAGPSHPDINLTEEEKEKYNDAVMIQRFLNSSGSQLTSHGLSCLVSFPAQTSSTSPDHPTTERTPSLHPEPGLFALFRNTHISLLHRHAGVLYTLVTDHRFLNESRVVWERLRDINQDVTEYFDSNFQQVPDALGIVDQDSTLASLQSNEDRRERGGPARSFIPELEFGQQQPMGDQDESLQHPEQDALKPEKQIWETKTIAAFPFAKSRKYRIIMQNENGPYSFITICNILILRDQIVLPQDCKSVSFELLSKLVLAYIETIPSNRSNLDMSTKLRTMFSSITGMSFNPIFTSIQFRQKAGELALFSTLGIPLVHGWLVDPARCEEYDAVSRVKDYCSAQGLITRLSQDTSLNGEKKDAIMVRRFMDYSHSQLTSYGRSCLLSLPPQKFPSSESRSSSSSIRTAPESNAPQHLELYVLLRKSYIEVLCRHANELYTLVTDHRFLNKPSIVWALLVDTDRGPPIYFNSAFRRVNMEVEDFMGHLRDGPSVGKKTLRRSNSKIREHFSKRTGLFCWSQDPSILD